MENIDKYHARMTELKHNLGSVCVRCGSTENLEIDHIDPTQKSFTISQNAFAPIELLYLEIEKCQLLCKNCHVLKTKKEQTTRLHGTATMYRRGKCRCELCVTANSSYQSKYDNRRVWCKLCKKRFYKKCPTHGPAV